MTISMLDYVGHVLPDDVKSEMHLIEAELYKLIPRAEGRSTCTSNSAAAVAIVWCVRELVALRKTRTTPAVLRERA